MVFSAGAQAAEYYIKVAALRQKNSILDVKWQLEDLGYRMVYRYQKGWYRVYAGPFARQSQAQQALARIRQKITQNARMVGEQAFQPQALASKPVATPVKPVAKPSVTQLHTSKRITMTKSETPIVIPRKTAAVSGSAPVATHTAVQAAARTPKPEPRIEMRSEAVMQKHQAEPVAFEQPKAPMPLARDEAPRKPEQHSGNESYDFYAALSAGVAGMSVEKVDTRGSVTLNDKPDERDATYGMELGYYFNNSIFGSVNYDKTDFEDVEFDHLYLTLNYRFRQYDLIRPYIGLIAGYSKMAWKKSLIDSTNNDLEGSTFYNGLQAGVDYLTIGPVSCYLVYRYLFTEYETDIITFAADAVLTHDQEQSLNVGLRYSF